ncbi:MerR family transcriptional regulator [Paenibacillus graminis]|uniref:MerR family transcriptional regulator n=1 Tax=Paenibacillus graminis TaxID=189425 RepID=A0A089M6R7_9BACL|nr:MerR family transcriptional regulator [Paenibacillus graminis]AIQ68080.1 MerR family transcriptional regulator [Paenibacillus graminis]
MYTINEVANSTGLSPHTVRFYAKKELFPNITRNHQNVRLFSSKDVEYVEIVKALRLTGMSLGNIKRYIDLCEQGSDTVEERYNIIRDQQLLAEDYLQEVTQQIMLLRKKVNYYKQAINEGEDNIIWNPNNL